MPEDIIQHTNMKPFLPQYKKKRNAMKLENLNKDELKKKIA